ncbi:DUF547 domain-containing protein [Pedobacter sp. SD-b]|uniref:DUF547 domain-containing protein n=2 Tax=Pedobacter segetis TaxID=2793069 RepID=A0ABS1BID1_9SPHI|nr:DUF547 domain-containing protein [Pedobacter segetis]
MKTLTLITFISIFAASCGIKKPQKPKNADVKSTMYNDLSEKMVEDLKAGRSVKDIQDKFANVSEEDLRKGLPDDANRKSFWINVYNGYIIAILKKDKSQYKDRNAFFAKKQVKIAGHTLSFDDIENGMIRKSQYKFGLGYIRKILPSAFERHLRVDDRDFRIHFTINCGAKSCPPVRVYKPDGLYDQLENAAKAYLTDHTKYYKEKNQVESSVLMSYFRGDFGGKSGQKTILKDFKLIPENSDPKITYGPYDWTLDIDNFAK